MATTKTAAQQQLAAIQKLEALQAKMSPFLLTLIGTFINMTLQEAEGTKLFKDKVEITEVTPDGTTVKLKFGKKSIYKLVVGRWVD